ncbi:hypothetical protein J6590_043057, partial [Homalodisca vitripennis]
SVIIDDCVSKEVEERRTAHEDNEDEEIDEETVGSPEIESDEEESSNSAKRASHVRHLAGMIQRYEASGTKVTCISKPGAGLPQPPARSCCIINSGTAR